jgi:hypothetical protein
MQHSVVLFYSTSGALQAEKLLKKEGVTTKLIPVPRHLSSDCGICLRFEQSEETRVRVVLEEGQVEIQGIYPL